MADVANVDSIILNATIEDNEDETKLLNIFKLFCDKDEMDLQAFIRFCESYKMATQSFTVVDCDLIFEKSKALATHPTASDILKSGVVLNKRINYFVFRIVVVPYLAEKKKCIVGDILQHILAQDDVLKTEVVETTLKIETVEAASEEL